MQSQETSHSGGNGKKQYTTQFNFYEGYIKDFDSNKPIKNVSVSINKNITLTDSTGYFSIDVTSNTTYTLDLEKDGYARKKIIRKPDLAEKNADKKVNTSNIYMFKNESDFTNKIDRSEF